MRRTRKASAVPLAVASAKPSGWAVWAAETMAAATAVPTAPESYWAVLQMALPSVFMD